MHPFIIAFLATFVAEIGDKTQLVTLTMSSRGSPRQVFLGAMLALALVTGLGVVLGELVAGLFPTHLVALGSGIFFLFMGIHTYFRKDSQKTSTPKETHFLDKPLDWSFWQRWEIKPS